MLRNLNSGLSSRTNVSSTEMIQSTVSEFSKNLKFNIWVDLVSSQWSLNYFRSFQVIPRGGCSFEAPYTASEDTLPVLSSVLFCPKLFRTTLCIFFSSIFVVNKNMRLQLFCIDKGKNSTSDLDQEIDFQKKMMDVSSGSSRVPQCSFSERWSGRHLWTHPRPRTDTNSGHHCRSRHGLPPQSHFQSASVVFHNMK